MIFGEKWEVTMNTRIRKKQLKRTLCKLAAAYGEYEAARERVFRKALQEVTDAYGKSRESSLAVFRGYMEVACLMAFSGPPPEF